MQDQLAYSVHCKKRAISISAMCKSILLIGILQFWNGIQIVHSLQVAKLPVARKTFSAVYSENSNSAGVENVEGSSGNGGAGGLMSMGTSLKSQLASAFSALDESDQYSAVVSGLCAKILDEPSMAGDQVVVALQDPIQLFGEMNSRRVKASGRSIMALIDVSQGSRNDVQQTILSLTRFIINFMY